MNLKRSNRTIIILICIMLLISLPVIGNVLFTTLTGVHLRSKRNVIEFREPSISNSNVLHGTRGTIYDRNGEVIAEEEETYKVVAIISKDYVYGKDKKPLYVTNYEQATKLLAPVLHMEEKEMLDIFYNGQKGKQFQVEFGAKGSGLNIDKKRQIEALKITGITFATEARRSYPTSVFASNLIGFTNTFTDGYYDRYYKSILGDLSGDLFNTETNGLKGVMGLEKSLNDVLSGKNGLEIYDKDAKGYMIPGTKRVEKYAENGNDVYLTLDHNVQLALQNSLKKTMKKTDARRGWGIVMEVETGKILGYAGMPSFDLNKHNVKEHLDLPSQYAYEPGSVMKGITYAAAIDSGNYPYDEKYRSGVFYYGTDKKGKIYRSSHKVGGIQPIRDALNIDHGTITFDKGFVVSSNIAICELLTNHMDPEIFKDYVKNKFMFTKPVSIPFIDNANGSMNFSDAASKLNAGFGQGISVTALQMVQAYSAILNDGQMVRPYIVDRITDANQKVLKQYDTQVIGHPISKKTANYVTDLMYQVVEDEEGTGHRRYKMDNVSVVAKTGTGQIYEQGVGYGDVFTNSVIAAAPADDPKVMVYYVFESSDFSSYTGEPFKETMKAALVAANITGEDSHTESSKDKNDVDWNEYEMPSLTNHSISYAKKKLKDVNVDTTIIGNGKSVVAQYPSAASSVITNQHIFLLTDGTHMTMPNMKGWTKKDITAFWKLTKLAVVMDGSGSVVSQNIEPGASINKDSIIKVKMK